MVNGPLWTAEYDPERPQRGTITAEHHRAADAVRGRLAAIASAMFQ
jgi:hypothetical protein